MSRGSGRPMPAVSTSRRCYVLVVRGCGLNDNVADARQCCARQVDAMHPASRMTDSSGEPDIAEAASARVWPGTLREGLR
jgi:hypothetical protein